MTGHSSLIFRHAIIASLTTAIVFITTLVTVFTLNSGHVPPMSIPGKGTVTPSLIDCVCVHLVLSSVSGRNSPCTAMSAWWIVERDGANTGLAGGGRGRIGRVVPGSVGVTPVFIEDILNDLSNLLLSPA